MPSAIRTATRIQDQDDFAGGVGAGLNGFVVTYVHAAGNFQLVAAPGGGASDHGALSGLADDDHTQYALLAGRGGGQTLIGATGAGQALVLQGTSHATKGKVVVGQDWPHPITQLHVKFYAGTGYQNEGLKLDNIGTGHAIVLAVIAGPSLYLVKTDGSAAGLTIGNIGNPNDGSALANSTGMWWVSGGGSAGQFWGVNTAPASRLHTLEVDAATNSATTVHTTDHNTSGTPAAGFGTRSLWRLESSTSTDQQAGAIDCCWSVATHASRSSEWRIHTVTNAGALTEVARIDGGGGASPAAGNTGLMLWDVDNGTLERVSVGAADSGGTGYKLLRIPN